MKNAPLPPVPSPHRLWQAQRCGFVLLMVSVLLIGLLSLLNVQRGINGYRHLSQEVVPVTAALERLRFSALGMIAPVSEFGMIARLEGANIDKAAAMVGEVHEFNRNVEDFNHGLADYRSLASRLYPQHVEEVEQIFHEGNRLKLQARDLLWAARDGVAAPELFALKEDLEQTERQFLGLVAARLEYQGREVAASNAQIATAQERQFLVLTLGGLLLVALVLWQRKRVTRICRACGRRPVPVPRGPEGPPQISSP